MIRDRKQKPTGRPATLVAAVGYSRVSTSEQAEEGLSLDAQEARVRAYALAKDLELVEVIRDEGLSGKDLRRPGIDRLVAVCKARGVGAVIVMKLDRLTRRTRDLLYLVEDVFEANDVTLHSLHETVDTSSASGRFFLRIMGALAEMEREQIGERTRSALAFKRDNGQPTSHPPLGFRPNGSKRHRMVPVPEELAVVQQILDLHRRGQGYHAIAAKLTEGGVPSKRGGRWHAFTVKKVCDRRAWYARALSAS